jgi:DNA-3-methyladenine glycosylase I
MAAHKNPKVPQAATGPDLIRCPWALGDPLSMDYHDHRWGRPVKDDPELFKMLILEGMQAGLNWSLILKKEKAIIEAFDGLNPEIVQTFGSAKIEEIMLNPAVIRNRLKIQSVVTNAREFCKLAQEYGSFSAYLWDYVDNRPIVNDWRQMSELPARTDLSDKISLDLKKRGLKFIGSTIIYSFLQAIGLVNDHLRDCAFRFPPGGAVGKPATKRLYRP